MRRVSSQDKCKVVRGTVLVHRRRCGKPNCRCASDEELHESTVLSYKEGGRPST